MSFQKYEHEWFSVAKTRLSTTRKFRNTPLYFFRFFLQTSIPYAQQGVVNCPLVTKKTYGFVIEGAKNSPATVHMFHLPAPLLRPSFASTPTQSTASAPTQSTLSRARGFRLGARGYQKPFPQGTNSLRNPFHTGPEGFSKTPSLLKLGTGLAVPCAAAVSVTNAPGDGRGSVPSCLSPPPCLFSSFVFRLSSFVARRVSDRVSRTVLPTCTTDELLFVD